MKNKGITRPQMSKKCIKQSLIDLEDQLKRAIEKHGSGCCVSAHEVIGGIVEEFEEAKKEVHENNIPRLRSELLDIAIASLWGVISIDEGVIDGKWDHP